MSVQTMGFSMMSCGGYGSGAHDDAITASRPGNASRSSVGGNVVGGAVEGVVVAASVVDAAVVGRVVSAATVVVAADESEPPPPQAASSSPHISTVLRKIGLARMRALYAGVGSGSLHGPLMFYLVVFYMVCDERC